MCARLRQHVETAHSRQADVQQQQIDRMLLQLAQRFVAIDRLLGVVARGLEKCSDRMTQRAVIVDDKDMPAGRGSHLSLLEDFRQGSNGSR